MPVAPPILDLFVVWHPDELDGDLVLRRLQDHFHSQAFAGLAGGAVEVYARSAPWDGDGAPRPLGIGGGLAPGVQPAQRNVVLVVAGAELARAVDEVPAWNDYLTGLRAAQDADDVAVFTITKPGFHLRGTLAERLGDLQTLDSRSFADPGVLGRDVAQAITQWLNGGTRVRVFISHTKSASLLETQDADGGALFERVRSVILHTHLETFFDAQDIQPGVDWAQVLDREASTAALLMIRTDHYAGREWTQREVHEAKRHDVPIVCMYALHGGEERGSFLMDHVPSVPCDLADPEPGIETALNRLVDEALKRTLWSEQTVYLRSDGFDWLPVHAPEPVTLGLWLQRHQATAPDDAHVWIMHPDPPLGPREREVVQQMCAIAGYTDAVDVLTPRTFASQGGMLPK